MNRTPLFLAVRYLTGSSTEHSISIMVRICFLGILIGSCSLALIMSIMGGFERATHEQMQGIHAQILIKSSGNALDEQAILNLIRQEFPEVTGASPQYIGQTIVSVDGNKDLTHVVVIKGIDPMREEQTSSITKKIISPTPTTSLNDLVCKNHVLIGKQIATDLQLNIGDPLYLIYIQDQDAQNAQELCKKKVVVGGIFKTGIEEFDAGLIFSSIPLYSDMFNPQGADQISLKLSPQACERELIAKLHTRLGLEVYSWKDLYPALVSALKLEKYVMFFILALITLVASMNMISLLFMHITQKKSDIAILKTMGMSNLQVQSIFVLVGFSISCAASLSGLALAWIAGIFISKFPLITLPDVYYVSQLPIYLDYKIFIIIFMVVLLMSIIAAWVPIRKIKNIHIADVLRFEA
jgi:lipoprotein-releasing system permease protein